MNGKRRALVVAIDRYVHPMLRKLAAPTADAAALARVLGEPDLGGFEVEVLTDADSYQVTQAVEGLLSESGPSDLVLLHFSCHGIKDDSGELFLAATNTVPNRLVSTAVDAGLVNRLIQRSRAQRVVLLLDCCYGGAFERGVVARATGDVDVGAQFSQSSPGGGRGRVVITASSAMEYAFEGTTLTDSSGPTPSLFTGALVEGITSGEADRDQDGQVGLHELYDYVHDKVRARTPNQTPSKWEFGVQGDLFIARNPRRKILPARLPDELLEMVAHPTASVRLAAVQDLDQLAGGPNLRLAAGARLALQGLRGDDSRRVSAAATNALERTALRITPTHVDLGDVPSGSRPRVEIRVDGGPLALASSIEVTHERFHTRIEGSVLTITTTAAQPGPLDGKVRLSGPAGDAIVDIAGTVVATRRRTTQPGPARSDQPKLAARQDQLLPVPPEKTPTRTGDDPRDRPASAASTGIPERLPSQSLVALLLLVGAAATVGAALHLPPPNEPVRWAFFLPAVAGALAAAALPFARYRLAAAGTVAGAAIWMWLFWARAEVAAPTAGLQLWPRLVAAGAFSCATVALIAGQPRLRTAVAVRRDGSAVLGGCLVLMGGAMQVVLSVHNHKIFPPGWTQLSVLVVAFIPMTLLRLGPPQRRAALVSVIAFAIFVGAPTASLLLKSWPDNNDLAPVLVGLLLVVAGCFVSQAHRSPKPAPKQQ